MAMTDSYDLALSTNSDEAASNYRRGVDHMLAMWTGAEEALDAALLADPDFALARAARARHLAVRAQIADARTEIAAAEGLVARRGTERERSHVNVLSLALSGQSAKALDAALAHADLWPHDTLILSLPLGAFGLFAFSGMAHHDQARVDLCEHHASSFTDDDWWFLTNRGWSLAENGEVARGRAMLERSLEIRRESANGVHALAHAMYEGGAGDDAGALIADWLPDYDRSGILHGHIAWHGALVALERGDTSSALATYKGSVHPSVSKGMPINVVSDTASFLWRMQAYGHEVPAQSWREISDYAHRAFPRAGHNFVDPHMAMIEAATGDREGLTKRVEALEDLIAKDALSAGKVVPTIARAAQAFAEADYATCIRVLEPQAHEVVRIGGSGAQREIIEDTLLVAFMRDGQAEKARALLDRRLHRRPSPRDAMWLASLPVE
ncbi:tetratricopeptide repeat protein [Phenylobacterium koreense]|uniref:Tetratricopeptide repeat protein 38 n=1 Tax=Phenylobacterium koreense TaxID=266125 RepID=A0ABV2EM02_9CAUL